MTDTPFELRTSRIADTVEVVDVIGEIDMATAPSLTTAIGSIQDGIRRVVVNLTEATFLDSSALNALVNCQRDLHQRGIAFWVVSPLDRNVRRVFEITNLIESLSVVECLNDALG
jgi:anti-anti-sigma factor